MMRTRCRCAPSSQSDRRRWLRSAVAFFGGATGFLASGSAVDVTYAGARVLKMGIEYCTALSGPPIIMQ